MLPIAAMKALLPLKSTLVRFPCFSRPLQTVSSPREFDIDPSGTYLYAAGETSDDLAWYRIDKTSGALDSLGCSRCGETPFVGS